MVRAQHHAVQAQGRLRDQALLKIQRAPSRTKARQGVDADTLAT